MNLNLTAEEKMSKARTLLVLDDLFFGTLSMKMDLREAHPGELKSKTIGVDGKAIKWDRDYIDKLTLQESKAELAHECCHVAFKHHLRRGDREHHLWNVACDFAIDQILYDSGYRFYNGGAIDPAFKDMGAEEIFKILDKLPKNDGDEQGNDSTQGPGQPGKTPGPSGSGQPPPPGQPPQPSELDKKKQKTHGEVLDAPINLKDKKEVQQFEEDLNIAIEQASKQCGSLPGGLQQLIKANKEHKINYLDLLEDWLEKNAFPSDYNWLKPNRRYLSQGIMLPGFDTEEEIPEILFGVDTSGSIGARDKEAYANEISGVLEQFNCRIRAVYVDTRVANVQMLDSDDLPIDLKFRGGGGTRFSPLFDYVKENNLEPKAILYFTDLCCGDFGEDPGIPVLWLNTYRNNDDKSVPFGEVIKLELDKHDA